MQHTVQLSVGKQGNNLSKEQQKFNGLLEKIKQIKQNIVAMRSINAQFHTQAAAIIAPAQQQSLEANQQLVLELDKIIAFHKLTKKQYQKFCSIMKAELEDLIQRSAPKEKAEFKILFEKYANVSFEVYEQQQLSQIDGVAGDMLEYMFGFDIKGFSEFANDPEKMQAFIQEKMREQQEQQQAAQQARKERIAEMPKTPAQLKKEAAEKEMSKTTKQIYMDLVKNFHPDQEQDEKEILRKTAIMQEVVAAYQEDNFIKLLELQMTLLENRENSLSKLDDKQLKHFTKVLQEQYRVLREEYEAVSPNPSNNPYYELFAEEEWVRKIKLERAVASIKQQTEQYVNTIEAIQTIDGLKKFVKQFQLPEMGVDFFNF
jgi:hypothetical protein